MNIEFRTRIAIPLFRSRPWLEVIAANVGRLAPFAAVTISDATGDDDCLRLLHSELQHLTNVQWIGPRPCAPGWVGHCNDLLERSTEEYFAWLPHDDEVGSDWVTEAESLLDQQPGSVLALGTIVPIHEPGVTTPGYTIEPPAAFGNQNSSDRLRFALDLCLSGDTSFLGACFRGVQRRLLSVPLPATKGYGEWSDILWALELLTYGPIARMQVVYGKRWHGAGAHLGWSDARQWREYRAEMIPAALRNVSQPDRERLLTHAWADEIIALRDRLALERSHAESSLRKEYEESTSWRITKPLRRASSAMTFRVRSRGGSQ